MAAAAIVRVLFLVTYPTSVAGDGVTYFRMMTRGTSSLIHAQGYPWLLTLALSGPRALARAAGVIPAPQTPDTPSTGAVVETPDRVPAAAPPGRVSLAPDTSAGPAGPAGQGQALTVPRLKGYLALLAGAFNHAIGLAATACLWFVLRAVFSTPIAVAGALVYGASPWNVQWAAHTRPEGVTADLFVIGLAATLHAWRAAEPGAKRWRYALAAAVGALALLAKGTAILVGLIPIALFLVDRIPWRERLTVVLTALVVGGGIAGAFLVAHHRPTTGTWTLSHELCFALWDRVDKFPPVSLYDPDNGAATKKLAILRRVLPATHEYGGTLLFAHVDAVAPSVRAPWRENWTPLLHTRDADYVGRLWDSVRDRPEARYATVQYHLGLAEADRLLCPAFAEAVAARPGEYLAGTLVMALRALREPQRVLVPVTDTRVGERGVHALTGPENREPLGWGLARLRPGTGTRTVAYPGDPPPSIWMPGASLVTAGLRATAIPTGLVWLLAATGAVLALRGTAGVRPAEPGLARTGPSLVLGVLLVHVVLWAALVRAQNKEIRLVQPFLDALCVLGAWQVVGLALTSARRLVNAPPPPENPAATV